MSGQQCPDSLQKETPENLDQIPTLRPQTQKPSFRLPTQPTGELSLQDRLKAFLPQMAQANEELATLEREGKLDGKRLEDIEDGKEYVEMELGLGVLEDRKDRDSDSNDGSGDSDDSSEEDSESSEEDSENSSDAEEGSKMIDADGNDTETQMAFRNKTQTQPTIGEKGKERDVLGKLMGLKRGKKVGIQEVGE